MSGFGVTVEEPSHAGPGSTPFLGPHFGVWRFLGFRVLRREKECFRSKSRALVAVFEL